MTNTKAINLNGFTLNYTDKNIVSASYLGSPLSNLIKLPSFKIDIFNPIKSEFKYDQTLIGLAENIFDTIYMLNKRGEHCVAAVFGSYFYEILGRLDEQFKLAGCHVLNIPFWLSVIELERTWEQKHRGPFTHWNSSIFLSRSLPINTEQ